jgi:hypothetical protein
MAGVHFTVGSVDPSQCAHSGNLFNRRAPKSGTTGLQPYPKMEIRNNRFVDKMIPSYLRDLPFSRNQLLNSSSD